MSGFVQRVMALTKRPGQTFGFFLRAEQGEAGHLVRCLDMGGAAELAGMRDGDRILRVNGTFVDDLPHQRVVELVKERGVSVTFSVIDAASYERAKTEGVDLSVTHPRPPAVAAGGVLAALGPAGTPRLCYLVKASAGYGFSLRSVLGELGVFLTQVSSGGVAERAGARTNDRLLEVNGASVEQATHEQVVERIRVADDALMFLLVDEDTYRYYQTNQMKVGAGLATVKHLPHQPRIVYLTKGPEGYGFLLREDPKTKAHLIKDVDVGSPARRGGLVDGDRLVAVDGAALESQSHEAAVEHIRRAGGACCLLVVDPDTDRMYKMAGVSPMLYWEETKGSASPPSYSDQKEEELKPKLCKMQKTSAGYGFHINGIRGVCGQHIEEVVQGGAADRAGLQDGDVVVEVNSVNVESSAHEEVVALVHRSGASLELLVASQRVYDRLRARGAPITPTLLGPGPRVQTQATVEPRAGAGTPPPPGPPRPGEGRRLAAAPESNMKTIKGPLHLYHLYYHSGHSANIYPKPLTINTFVHRWSNNSISLSKC
uniref:PDZ domain-containing protein n=1 Tax=Gadus morhua TaxID=8049 RepID=A0A8C5BS86_GADMO